VPGERLKPNDFGLFDMLGNAMEWCQDRASYPSGEDVASDRIVTDKENRVWRSGAFVSSARAVRCASRQSVGPSVSDDITGFRVARTMRIE
jgi:formylglycine-generating enzyme required for sulfatase activity